MIQPKRVLCIHDLAALGRASLSAIVPVLAAMGCQPVALPTALLSVHTGGLGRPTVQDLGSYGPPALEDYARLGVQFDCIYSGYLANEEQTALVRRAWELWPDALRVLDPVMGDHGKIYSGLPNGVCRAMQGLCADAHILLPNPTEAAFLLGKDAASAPADEAEARRWAQGLAGPGQRVVLTGVALGERLGNVWAEGENSGCLYTPRCPRSYPGTGDLFAAALTGGVLGGASLCQAVETAADFVGKAVFASPEETRYGVWFEPYLHLLAPPAPKKVLNIVLVEPRIPQNTGNVARTCAATGARLHLVGPMGFTIDDKKLKRAGLDYWHLLDITYYSGLEDFFARNSGPYYYFSTKAPARYCDVQYPNGCYLVFGREDRGLPEQLLHENQEWCVRLPMRADARSLNLSNTVAIGVYEVLRQWDYDGLLAEGHLRNYEWE